MSRKNFCPSFVITIFLALYPLVVFSAELKIVPSISVREQYNDNVYFTERKKKDDYITILSPQLGISSRTEKSFFDATGTLEWRDYGKIDELDFLTQRYIIGGKYLFDPEVGISGSLGMMKDYSPDRDVTETGLITRAIKRSRYTGSFGIQKTFGEKTKSEVSIDYERVEYQHDPEYVDTNSYGASINLVQIVTPRTSGRLSFGYSFYEQRRVENDYYYGMLGFGYSLEERWNLYVDGGLSYLRTDLEITPFVKKTEKGTGWVGRSVLSYKGEKETVDFTFYRRISPATGIYGVSERNFFSVTLSYRFTYELSSSLEVSYITNRAKKGKYALSELDERTFLFTPRIRYNLSPNMFLEASYSFNRLRDRYAHSTAKRNLFMINFTIKHPIERGI
ncbi:MAG: outer membrane beta-barrel protein [Deltaproteobacteria bacterium]|nr:outer membrane beta-barrel protein [Deltaproteobacteria bacterium]